jgi:ABC-2 type transport system permease protein
MLLTVLIYDADGSLMDIISEYMGGGIETDVFAVIDGINEDLLSVAGELGVDIPTEAMSLMDSYFGDGEKVKYLTTSPEDYYYSLNPARLFEDELRTRFSDGLADFILYDRSFLELMITTDTLTKALQDFSAGNGNALITDTLKLIRDNAYLVGVAAAAVNLAVILQSSSAIKNINESFEGLKDRSLKDDGYTVTVFYSEFFGAALNYGGEVTLLNMSDAIAECYEQTRLRTVHGVSASEFFTAAAPRPYDLLLFYRDVYDSGIFAALANPDRDFSFLNFVLETAVLAASPYVLTADDEEKYLELPEDYGDLSGPEKETAYAEAYADAVKRAKFDKVKDFVFGYLEKNYPGYSSYAKNLPLFNAKTLKKLVPDASLQSEILAGAPDIIDIYAKMFGILLNDGADNYKALTDYILYVAALGGFHDALYSSYSGTMTAYASELLRIQKLLNYYYNGGDYGKTSMDFIKDEVFAIGAIFDGLLGLVNDGRSDASYDEKAYLSELTSYVGALNYAYSNLASYVWAGSGEITLGLYKSTGSSVIPEMYDLFERQWRLYSRASRSLYGVLNNSAKTDAVKIESVNRFVSGLKNNAAGFFYRAGQDIPMEEKTAFFMSSFGECYTAEVTEEFFEEKYAFLYGEIIKSFEAYFTAFKGGAIGYSALSSLFGEETAARFLEIYGDGALYGMSYAEFRGVSRVFTRTASLIADYAPKVYVIEVTETQNLNDKALSRIYGMHAMMGYGFTKYSIKSDIQKDLYYLENPEMYGSLTSADALDNGYGFMNFGISFTYIFIIMVALVIASGSIAGEYETGSIKLLLIRPYKRFKVLTAKLLFVAICLAVMYLCAYLFMLAVGRFGLPGWGNWTGFNGARDVLVIFDASRVEIMNPFHVITLEYLFYYIDSLMYAVIAVMVSAVAKSRVASVAVSGGVFFGSTILTALLSSYDWYRFIIFNNTNLFVYMAGGSSLADMTMVFSGVVYIVYLAAVLAAAYITFEKRDAV